MKYNLPLILYGTAWKEEQTSRLVTEALAAGFTGIDTANQRQHYFEEGVGQGLQAAYHHGSVSRKDLFLQTKYTYVRGQDHRLPYNPQDGIKEQVIMSCASSLAHLNTDYLDSLILHGPYQPDVLSKQDQEAWQAMESLYEQGIIKNLGISNVNLEQLNTLYSFASVKPKFVQNRCYAQLLWDKNIREYCLNNNIIYQGFSLLTANQIELTHPKLKELAIYLNKTIPQIIFRFCQQIEMLPLTGTTKPIHMKQDLDINEFKLTPEMISLIENVAITK